VRKGLLFDFDRRLLHYADWGNFILVVLLSVTGLFFVYSATYSAGAWPSSFFLKQLFGVLSGIALYGAIFFMNGRVLQRWGAAAYYLTLLLLVFTLVKGSVGGWGGQRWINLGFTKFQPSEVAKLFFPAFFVSTLDPEGVRTHASRFFIIIVVLLVSAILVLKQPDLGTAVIILSSGAILLWLARIGKTFFICAFVLAGICAPLAWSHLKPFQKQRVIVYLGGGSSRRERYQIEQSQIAIGSGGLWGKGYLKGTQNQLSFLPANRTDFIFSVICEELGFVGASTVILLFLLLFMSALWRISQLSSISSQLLAVGLIAPSIISMIINISMVIGLLPAVGIPLPFITYGISHLWIGFASMGWYNNVVARASITSITSTTSTTSTT